MNNRKITYQSVPFTVLAGTTRLVVNKKVWEGRIINAVINTDGVLPNQLITFGIDDSGNKTLVEKSSIKDWQQRSGGDYLSSMKPLNIQGSQDLKLEFNALANLAANLSGEILFVLDQTNC